jgi:hypothetical protein
MFIERNIIRGNAYGVAAVNFSPDEPVRLRVVLHDNHIIANHLGLHTRNTAGTDRGQYQLDSAGNLFEGNWAAVEATAGTDLGTPDGAHDNRYELTSIGDTFRRNFLVSLLIVGAWRVNDGASAESNNLMELTVLDGTFDDAEAVHAWPVVFWPAAGDTGNRIKLLIRGARHSPGMNPHFRILDPLPDDSNSALVVGGDTAFSASNGAPLAHDGFMPPHPFDMSGSALHFTPTGNGYAVTAGSAALDLDVGDPVPLMGCDLDDPPCYPVDDDTGEIPFSFSFEGQAYPSLWVNSDGNITFGEGDRASDNRDVKRLVTGPPRIAAFLEDLAVDQGGELLYKVHPDRLVITWSKIPTWRLNLEDENTIQVILHADTSASCPGCFDIVYGVVESEDAVVGFSQGGWAQGWRPT